MDIKRKQRRSYERGGNWENKKKVEKNSLKEQREVERKRKDSKKVIYHEFNKLMESVETYVQRYLN